MHRTLTAAALALLCATAQAHIPASTTWIAQNRNGGVLALYHSNDCYTGYAIYSESPLQHVTSRGCVTDTSDDGIDVHWDDGNDTQLPWLGWTKAKGL